MPLPLIFIGIAVASGMAGIGSAVKGGVDQSNANKLNDNTEARLEEASLRLEEYRKQCSYVLGELGKEKTFVLNGNIKGFLNSFEKLKNVDFSEVNELTEVAKLHIDTKEFEELEKMKSFASSLIAGTVSGIAGGAMAAFGAYSAAGLLAHASTGIAISHLSGVAASNATLAFFGGGSLAAGGIGVAGGAAVLGGLVAGPALLIMGTMVGAKAGKNLELAKINAANANENCAQLESGAELSVAIRRRAYMHYNLLTRLDSYFLPLIYRMEKIIDTEGTDYSKYSGDSRKVIATAASTAVTIKAILNTPLLNEDGSLTEDSSMLIENSEKCSDLIGA